MLPTAMRIDVMVETLGLAAVPALVDGGAVMIADVAESTSEGGINVQCSSESHQREATNAQF